MVDSFEVGDLTLDAIRRITMSSSRRMSLSPAAGGYSSMLNRSSPGTLTIARSNLSRSPSDTQVFGITPGSGLVEPLY
jgi:hypothetical protein